MDTPDIANADRRMRISEFNKCAKNGVRDISETIIGYDATVLVQDISNKTFNITKKEFMLAFLNKVPSKDGISLIENPYKKWSDINPSLPRKDIILLNVKNDDSSLITIENMLLKPLMDKMMVFNDIESPYAIREDNAHVAIDTREQLIQQVKKNKMALGIMSYSLANQYKSKVEPILIESVSPSIESISMVSYPLSNRLYFYSKNRHKNQITSMQPYLEQFMTKGMIGREGKLSKLGLIPLGKNEMYTKIKYMREGKKLLLHDLSSDFFHLAL